MFLLVKDRHFVIIAFKIVKDGSHTQVYKLGKESVTRFSQLISVSVKKILRKSQPQFWEKLRKLRLRKNDGFLIKKASKAMAF